MSAKDSRFNAASTAVRVTLSHQANRTLAGARIPQLEVVTAFGTSRVMYGNLLEKATANKIKERES